jgi:hypothetical protein
MECLESDQNRIPLLRSDHRQLISILKLHSAAWARVAPERCTASSSISWAVRTSCRWSQGFN